MPHAAGEHNAKENLNWTSCPQCKGIGKKRQKPGNKARARYQAELDAFEKSDKSGLAPVAPKGHFTSCLHCNGSGLIAAQNPPLPNTQNLPHVAIIGAGIGGVALAVACLHRGIPFTLYERDTSFEARSQGYGLTLQQAGKAIKALGISSLKDGVVSTRHLVHNTHGKVIGEWGMRKWVDPAAKAPGKHSNIHIARQSLRAALLEKLGENNSVEWGHQLVEIAQSENNGVQLRFEVNGETRHFLADLVVGADGIRSSVRRFLFGNSSPLRYLDCIVILGICPLKALEGTDSPLLNSGTVFQTANGSERIYIMPFTFDSVMWQLSFPMPEQEAKKLSAQGPHALKEEAQRRTHWHAPIPQILAATRPEQISGYPVYDRELLKPEMMEKAGPVTLIGDAAHPMSPFKGQGANQALLDALSLARAITRNCTPFSDWRKTGLRKSLLSSFEREMLERSAVKVKDSAAAAMFLHSDIVLAESDQPRGSCLKKP